MSKRRFCFFAKCTFFASHRSKYHHADRTDSVTNGIISQYARSPLAELRGTDIVDAIAYAENGIEIVELSHIVFAVRSSCRDFLGN